MAIVATAAASTLSNDMATNAVIGCYLVTGATPTNAVTAVVIRVNAINTRFF